MTTVRDNILQVVRDVTETFTVQYEEKKDRQGRNRPFANVGNLALLLLQDRSWTLEHTPNGDVHVIAKDQRSGLTVKRGPCPWPAQLASPHTPAPGSLWDDTDLALLRGWFELKHGIQVSRQTCKEVVSIVAQKNTFDSSGLSVIGQHTTEGAFTVDDFLALDIPEPKKLLGDWLTEESLTLVYALPGVGKTIWTMEICRALCTGTPSGKWSTTGQQKVLYVDGEMGRGTAQKRLRILKRQGINKNFRFLSKSLLQNPADPDQSPTTIPDLATKEGQDFIERHIQDAKVIVLDNLSSLVVSGDENEAGSWLPLQQWLFSLRSRGLAVILIHHAGKNGTQRGTSRKMDAVNNCIQLSKPEGYRTEEGARIKIHFEKARDAEPGADVSDFEVSLTTDLDGTPVWAWNDSKSAKREVILSLHKEELTVTEIAKEVGCDKGYVSRIIKKHKESGERVPPLTVDSPYRGRGVNSNVDRNTEVNKPSQQPVNSTKQSPHYQRETPARLVNSLVNNRSTAQQDTSLTNVLTKGGASQQVSQQPKKRPVDGRPIAEKTRPALPQKSRSEVEQLTNIVAGRIEGGEDPEHAWNVELQRDQKQKEAPL